MNHSKPRQIRLPHSGWFYVAGVLAVLVVVGAFVSSIVFRRAYWVGHKSLQLEFQILDAKTQQPIENSSVVLFESMEFPQPGQAAPRPSDTISTEVKSDSAGRVLTTHEFTTAGHESIVESTGVLYLTWWWVQIRANGYEDAAFQLSQRFGRFREIGDNSPLSMTVALEKR